MKIRGDLKIFGELNAAGDVILNTNNVDIHTGQILAAEDTAGKAEWRDMYIPEVLARGYPKRAVVTNDVGDKLYISLVENAPGNQLTNTSYWAEVTGSTV